ncbi:acyltransferase [Intrasporangium sp.]|uniref:acyltransferase family protein n=1 Tax=Intrasporangium sp. TaxID=1925024 RepID=UPI003365B2A0
MTVSALAQPGARHRTGRPRNDLLDGLRGIAIVLVVLSHFGIVWSPLVRWDLGPIQSLFEAGNIGVSMFLVIGGFLVTGSLLRARAERGWTGPLSALSRRTVRISIQVYVLLVVVLLMARLDPTDTTPESATLSSVRAVATYTWNEYVRHNALNARSDLGALYYLSIELQVYLVLLVLLLVLWRARTLLIVLVGLAIPVVTWWRWYAFDSEGWYQASLMTTTRMDGLLYGILAALLVHRLGSVRRHGGGLLGSGLLLIVAAVVSTAFTEVDAYFGVQGVVIAIATTLFAVGAVSSPDPRTYGFRAMSWRPLGWLGRRSITIFIWHLPVFAFVARRTGEWAPPERALVAVALLTVVVLVVDRFVADPATRLVAGWWRGVPARRAPGQRGARGSAGRRMARRIEEEFADDPLYPDDPFLLDDPRSDLGAHEPRSSTS